MDFPPRRHCGHMQRLPLLVACCAVLAACTGRLLEPAGGGAGDTGGGPAGVGGTSVTGAGGAGGAAGAGGDAGAGGIANPPPFQPASGMLRRLTRPQFRNAVRDVFGVEVNIADLDADTWNAGFATIGASDVVTSERGVEQYHSAIEDAVNALFADANRRAQFIGCTPTGQTGDPCVRGYIQKLGLRAWRRPLTSTELDRFVALANKAATDLGNAIEGARWAT